MNGLLKVLSVDNRSNFPRRIGRPVRRDDLDFRLACIDTGAHNILYTKLTNYIYIIILPSSHRFVRRRRSIVSRILSCCRIAGAAKARRLALRATPVAKVRGALDVRRRDLVHVGTGRSDKVGHPGRRCITRGPFAFARRRRWSVLRGHFKVAVHASHERLVLVDELGYAIAARQDKTSAFNYSKTKTIFSTIYSFIY